MKQLQRNNQQLRSQDRSDWKTSATSLGRASTQTSVSADKTVFLSKKNYNLIYYNYIFQIIRYKINKIGMLGMVLQVI